MNTLHLSSVALRNLNFFGAWSFGSSSWTLLSTALFVGAADKLYFLINFNWSETNSIRIDVSIWFHSTVYRSISKRVIDLKLSRFVCGWTWKLCFNICSVHCFFNSIDVIKSWSLRRFLCCVFAFVVNTNSLRITFNNHWFKWWNFFFIIIFNINL